MNDCRCIGEDGDEEDDELDDDWMEYAYHPPQRARRVPVGAREAIIVGLQEEAIEETLDLRTGMFTEATDQERAGAYHRFLTHPRWE